MGSYIPVEKKKKTSVIDTLREAEENHFLDCPNAELRLRVAAVLLDFLLSALAISGLQHLCTALQAHLGHLPIPESAGHASLAEFLTTVNANAYLISNYAFIGLKVAFAYFYFVWSLAFAGGSPGKLMLGLRVIHHTKGNLPSFPSALLREITKVFGVSFIAGIVPIFLRPDRRAAHDLVAGTVVKRVHGRL